MILKKIFFISGLLFSFYLVLPAPSLPPPDLPNSIKSTEPGDTIQIPNTAGYFTDKTRKESLDYYTNYFSSNMFFKVPFLTYRLNYPPEFAKEVFVSTKQSYYLEEIVHPLRESMFVNGFEWQNDVFTSLEGREKNKIVVNDKVWLSKVSLRWFYSSPLVRLTIFWSSWLLFYFCIRLTTEEAITFIGLFRQGRK